MVNIGFDLNVLDKSKLDTYAIWIELDNEEIISPPGLRRMYTSDIAEIAYMDKTKSKTKMLKEFILVRDTYDKDNVFINMVRTWYEENSLYEKPNIVEEELSEIIYDTTPVGKSIAIMCPSKLERLMMICAIAPKYKLGNPPWIMIVGGPGTGKSYALNHINHPTISHWGGKNTANALLPGKATSEDTAASVFENANGKVLIYNEMSTVLGDREENVRKHFGLMNDIYGGHTAIDDPTGHRDIESHFTCIWGITWQSYKKHIPLLSEIGPRFLIYPYYTEHETCHFEQFSIKFEDRKDMIIQHVQKVKDKYSEIISYTGEQELVDYATEFAHKLVLLRSVPWVNNIQETEHGQRLANQLMNIATLNAMLDGRNKPSIQDFQDFQFLAYRSIPYGIFWSLLLQKRYFNDVLVEECVDTKVYKNMIENGVSLGILDDGLKTIVKQWIGFIKMIFKSKKVKE